MLKVCKFGGSSMADAAQYEKVAAIIEKDPSRSVIVVSAPGKRYADDHKITDLLYLCHAHLQYGVACDSIFSMIHARFTEIRDALSLSVDLESDFEDLKRRLDKKMPQDELVSRGEYFSAKLLSAYLGFEFIDSARWVVFHYDGSIDLETSYENLRVLAANRKVVIPGFYGVMPDGQIRVMSRGGSDITGALAAAALSADVYENWTDVSGILMADPRIVEDAKPIDKITYDELRELSYIGAQVLHEDTIFPVKKADIALNIRNTNDPDHPGTLIRSCFTEEAQSDRLITGIAGKKGFSAVTVTKAGMSSKVGEYRRILSIFEKYGVSVHYTNSGIDCYSLFAENSVFDKKRYAILADLEKETEPDDIHVYDDIAVLAIVGRKMSFRSGSSARIFEALAEAKINVRMISQGPEELNIIIGVKEENFKDAIRTIYRKFVN